MAPTPPSPMPVDPPRGLYPAKVDEKGRLKLPTNFAGYLAALQATKVFVTSLDQTTAKVYTIPVWNENVNLLQNGGGENRNWGKDILLLANILGADAELDSAGRLLLPTELRRMLGLENAPVWLEAYEGLINIYSQQVFEEKRRRAQENLQAKLQFMEGLGLK
ncbi:MAG: hypothetical protein IT165_02900 [Bryobacterales bacterium]|nr:hypothetical protein [Bryobacterales bacterium]